MVKRNKKPVSEKAIEDLEAKLDAILEDTSTTLEDKIDALNTLMGALTDESDLMGSVLSRSRTIFDNVHVHVGMVVADKTSLTETETSIIEALEKKYQVYIIDDDDIDAGNFDLGICELIIVSTSVTDMTKINNLTTVAVPIFTRNAEAALTILRIGDDSGGSGVSWGENATETAINIVDNTHEITTDQSVGSLTVYSPAGRIQWIRATDVVAGAHELAEIDGDNTKSTIIVLPYDVDDEDGNPTPALRVFIGLREFSSFNTNARNIMFNALDWAIHQWLFSVEVAGLGKINTVINMLGRKDFTPAKNLYDHLVTGTTDVIAEQESRSVMERLEWIKNGIRRGTGTILPANKSLYDYLLDIEGKLDVPANFMADVSGLAPANEYDAQLSTTERASASALATHDGKLDTVDTVVDAIKINTDKMPRLVSHMDFWSGNDNEITITTVSGNINLPNCVVAGLPANITIIRVVAMLKIAIIKDTSGSDNAVNSATMVLKVDADPAYGSTVTAMDIPDNSWTVDVSEATERGGDAMIGDHDIKAEVTGNATFYGRFENAACDGNNLKLKDVAWGLRIFFTV